MTRKVTAAGKTVRTRGYRLLVSNALRTLDDDELVRVSRGHPLIRHLAPHRIKAHPGWAYGRAVALVSGYWDNVDVGGDIMMTGPAEDSAALARLLLPEGRPMSLPRAGYELLPPGLLTEPSPWSFRWTDIPTGVAADAAAWVDDPAAIDELLDEAFPEASFRPSSSRVRGWAAVRDDPARGGHGFAACAADTTEAPGVGFVAAIATRTDLRGKGLGKDVTGWIVDRLVEREGTAALWHFDGNVSAGRVYDALGMHRLAMTAARPAPS